MKNVILYLFLFLSLTACKVRKDRVFIKSLRDDYKVKLNNENRKLTSEKIEKVNNANVYKVEEGLASWYGKKKLIGKSFHGKKTASGDKFNTDSLTAAHKTLPLYSLVKVTNLENKKTIIVMINDRGPAKKARIIDVSSKAATILNFKNKGIAKVKVETLISETSELREKFFYKIEDGEKNKWKMTKGKQLAINRYIKLINSRYNIKVY